MSNGYRGLVLAIAGLALIGAAPPKEPPVGDASDQQRQEAASPTRDYAPYSDIKSDDCYKAKNHDSADLCAQWRAAFAAEKAAELSWWGNLIGGIAAILSLASIIMVVFALRQTDKSLRLAQKERVDSTRRAIAGAEETDKALAVAERNALAVIQANDIARTGQRAWVSCIFSHYIIGPSPNGGHQIMVHWDLKNVGETPALQLVPWLSVAQSHAATGQTQLAEFIQRALEMRRDGTAINGGVIGPKDDGARNVMGVGIDEASLDNQGNHALMTLHVGAIYKILGSDEEHLAVRVLQLLPDATGENYRSIMLNNIMT